LWGLMNQSSSNALNTCSQQQQQQQQLSMSMHAQEGDVGTRASLKLSVKHPTPPSLFPTTNVNLWTW
jgi:hypothetical protein